MDSILTSIGIVLVIVLFAVVIMTVQSRMIESTMLTGIWSGSPDFCTTSNLTAFILKLDDLDLTSGVRSGYLLAANDNDIILNHPINMSFSGLSIMPNMTERNYDIEIDWLDEKAPDFFPSQQQLTYYPQFGKIVMYVDDEVYAVLYKDHNSDDRMRKMPVREADEI